MIARRSFFKALIGGSTATAAVAMANREANPSAGDRLAVKITGTVPPPITMRLTEPKGSMEIYGFQANSKYIVTYDSCEIDSGQIDWVCENDKFYRRPDITFVPAFKRHV